MALIVHRIVALGYIAIYNYLGSLRRAWCVIGVFWADIVLALIITCTFSCPLLISPDFKTKFADTSFTFYYGFLFIISLYVGFLPITLARAKLKKIRGW
jgi:hypothetical protein